MNKIGRFFLFILLLITLVSCRTVNLPVTATSQDLGRLVGTSSGTIWLGLGTRYTCTVTGE